jgi:NADPH2 dehydrogenase
MKSFRGLISLFIAYMIFQGWAVLFIIFGNAWMKGIGAGVIAFWFGPGTPTIPLILIFALLIQRYVLLDSSNSFHLKSRWQILNQTYGKQKKVVEGAITMLYDPFILKNLNLKNRIVMPPMCMYSADNTGVSNDFHIAHYATRAIGGVGLIIQEATAIDPDGRISVNDLGIWDDKHILGLKRIVDVIHQHGSIAGIQINHAGRKAKINNPIGPSDITYGGDYLTPRAMTIEDIKKTINDFKLAAKRANLAGYDMLELHAAHGYLIFQFLSPISNHRTDIYQDGTLFLKEIVEAVRSEWPKEKVLCIRISAFEYVKEGVTPEMMANAILQVKDLGVDLVDVSSGGNILVKINAFPGYQLHLAKKIKDLTGLPVIGGGLITALELAEYAVSSNQADLIYLGRVLLRDPYMVINQAKEVGIEIEYPKPYIRGKK